MAPYPQANKPTQEINNMRVSLNGVPFMMPLRAEFLLDIHDEYAIFTGANKNAAGSLLMWEMFSPRKVAEGSVGCFANRGY